MSNILESLIRPFDEIEMNVMEYGHLMEPTHHSSFSFRIDVPKLMAGMGTGSPTSWSETVNTGIIVNDVSCKPSVSSSISKKNFLVIARQPDRIFSELSDPAGILHKGTRFQVVFMDKNPRDYVLNSTLR